MFALMTLCTLASEWRNISHRPTPTPSSDSLHNLPHYHPLSSISRNIFVREFSSSLPKELCYEIFWDERIFEDFRDFQSMTLIFLYSSLITQYVLIACNILKIQKLSWKFRAPNLPSGGRGLQITFRGVTDYSFRGDCSRNCIITSSDQATRNPR